MTELGFPWSMFTSQQPRVLRSAVASSRAAMALADVVTTVSPTLRAGDPDARVRRRRSTASCAATSSGSSASSTASTPTAWDPATDPALPAQLLGDDARRQGACRAALADELGLPLADDEPLIARDRAHDRTRRASISSPTSRRELHGSTRSSSCSAPASPSSRRASAGSRDDVPRARRGAHRLRHRARRAASTPAAICS